MAPKIATGPDSPSPTAPNPLEDPGFNNAQNLFGTVQPIINGVDSIANNQIGNLNDQMGLTDLMTQNQIGAVNQNLGFSLQDLGLSQQNLGIQSNTLARQGPLQQEMYGYQQQGLDIQQQRLGLSGQSLEDQIAMANRAHDRSIQQFSDSQAARGATNTVGTTRGTSDINQQLSDRLESINLSKQGLGLSQQQLDIQKNVDAAQFKENQAKLSDAKAGLDIATKRLNLSDQEIRAKADQAIKQLGLQNLMDTDKLMQAINDVEAGRFNALAPYVDIIMQSGAMGAMTGQGASANMGSVPGPASGGKAVDIAKSFIGIPYSYGGTDPNTGLDCSGLVQDVFKKMNITLPRTTFQQVHSGIAVPLDQSQWQPGDLIFYGSDNHHVGIYVGNGQMIDSPHTGASVRQEAVWSGVSNVRRVM